jgi:hypothetical protein
MSVHPQQARGALRHPNASVVMAPPAAQQYAPPPPTPLLKTTEVKRQFQQHADFQLYAKAVKKYLNGSVTKAEFHAELAKVLPTKEKMALHNWFILSIIKSAYSEYQVQKKGAHPGQGGSPSYKSQNLRSLSDHMAYKKRMQRTIMQHQLLGISDDAVSMVIVALQQHLLRTMAAMRSNPSINQDVEDPPENTEIIETSVPGDISSEDVMGTFWRRPSLLCENTSLIQHRLSVEQ